LRTRVIVSAACGLLSFRLLRRRVVIVPSEICLPQPRPPTDENNEHAETSYSKSMPALSRKGARPPLKCRGAPRPRIGSPTHPRGPSAAVPVVGCTTPIDAGPLRVFPRQGPRRSHRGSQFRRPGRDPRRCLRRGQRSIRGGPRRIACAVEAAASSRSPLYRSTRADGHCFQSRNPSAGGLIRVRLWITVSGSPP